MDDAQASGRDRKALNRAWVNWKEPGRRERESDRLRQPEGGQESLMEQPGWEQRVKGATAGFYAGEDAGNTGQPP